MHLFARRPYFQAKVLGCVEKIRHVSSSCEGSVIVAIKGFEILSHMLIDLGFEISNLPRGPTVKLVINLNGDFFHEFKVALKYFGGQGQSYCQTIRFHRLKALTSSAVNSNHSPSP